MKQEDLNDMMKTPEEAYLLRKRKPEPCKIFCPECGMAYLGDAKTPCLECQAKNNVITEKLEGKE